MFPYVDADVRRVVECLVPAVAIGAMVVWLASRWSFLPGNWPDTTAIGTLGLGFLVPLIGGGFHLSPVPVETLLYGGVISTTCLTIGFIRLQKNARGVLGWAAVVFQGWVLGMILHTLWTHRG